MKVKKYTKGKTEKKTKQKQNKTKQNKQKTKTKKDKTKQFNQQINLLQFGLDLPAKVLKLMFICTLVRVTDQVTFPTCAGFARV